MRNAGQAVFSSLQGLYYRAAPLNQFIGVGNSASNTDPDVAGFNSRWSSKISSMQMADMQQLSNIFQVQFGSQQVPINLQELADGLKVLKAKSSPEILKQSRDSVTAALDSLIQEATSSKERAESEQTRLQGISDAIVAKQGKAKTEITDLAIELGLPLFCVTVLLMLSIPIIVHSFSKAAGSSEQVRAIFSSGILVEIITVLLLTMTILILGLSSKIEGPVLGTLLGGISGYVLNRFRGKGQSSDSDLLEQSINSVSHTNETLRKHHPNERPASEVQPVAR